MSPIILTKEGYDKLVQELKDLEEIKLPEIRERLSKAREDGDLSENNTYLTAKQDLDEAILRVEELKINISNAIVGEDKSNDNIVNLGDELDVIVEGKKLHIQLVSSGEANPSESKFSVDSPLGRAIVGKKYGEKVEYKVDGNTYSVEILPKVN